MARYVIQDKLLSFPNRIEVTNEQGALVFEAKYHPLSIPPQLSFTDAGGAEIYRLKRILLSVHHGTEIDKDGAKVATLNRDLSSLVHSHILIDLADGSRLDAQGNFGDKEFIVSRSGQQLAQITRQWVSLRDTVGIDIESGQDEALLIAIAICINPLMEEKADS